MKYEVTVSECEFNLSCSKQTISLDNNPIEYSIEVIRDGEWLVYYNNKCHQVCRVEADGKKGVYSINGKLAETSISTEMDKLLNKLGMDVSTSSVINEIEAPMPGAILDVLVEVGQEIKAGDKLIILEAMKMENIIKSPIDGIITSIHVTIGDNVEKGNPLIEF